MQGPINQIIYNLTSSQVNFRLMAEYNISVSRLTELHSRFTSNKVNRMSSGKIKVKHWSFIAYADVLATDKIVNLTGLFNVAGQLSFNCCAEASSTSKA